jgi:hypothetical protein
MSTIQKSDEEIAGDIRQLYQELTKLEREMEKRGYEVRHSRYYDSDKCSVQFDRKHVL